MQQRWMSIVWPAFLAACLLEMGVFALIDPEELHWLDQPLPLSREGIYTLAFLGFWLVTGIASFLTSLLARSAAEINRCPLPPTGRPVGCPKREGDDGC